MIFAGVAAASADQSAATDATAKKPAATTTKPSHTASSHKTTHKSTAKSTSSSSKSSPSPSSSSASAGAKKSTSTKTKFAGKTHTASSGKHSSHNKKTARAKGQQKIDSERAQAIQEALIREHYMSGEASGTWNQASEEAMRRYQADHGWQSKTVPDSRALIKLGLGPSKDHLLNPESAMTTAPDAHTNADPPLPADSRPAGTVDQDAPRPQ